MINTAAILLVTTLVVISFHITSSASAQQQTSYSNPTPGIKVGHFPVGVFVNQKTHKVYVANAGSNFISVIDDNTGKVIHNVTGLTDYPEGIAINSETNMLYATARRDHVVSVINGSTDKVVHNIKVFEQYPFALSVNTKTNMLYVASEGSKIIYVINGFTNMIEGNIPLLHGFGGIGGDIAVNSNTNKVYVANIRNDTVSVIDVFTNGHRQAYRETDIPVARAPFHISIDPFSNVIYVVNMDAHRISVIDGKTDRVINPPIIPENNLPHGLIGQSGISVDPNTSKIYITSKINGIKNSSNIAYVIDLKTDKVTRTFMSQGSLGEPAVSYSTNKVYLPNQDSDVITVLDSQTDKVIAGNSIVGRSINVSTSVAEGIKLGSLGLLNKVIVNPSNNKVYVFDGNSLSVIDDNTGRLTGQLNFTRGLIGTNMIAINPKANKLYVQGTNSTILIIDSKTDKVMGNFTFGNNKSVLSDITVNPNTGLLYLNIFNSSVISIFDGNQKKIIKNIAIPSSSSEIGNGLGTIKGVNRMIVDENLDLMYTSELGSGRVDIIDLFEQKVIGALPVHNIDVMAVNPNTNLLYIGNSESGMLEVVDEYTKGINANISGISSVQDISIDTNRNIIYVANSKDDTIAAINGTTNKLTANTHVGNDPRAVSINPNTRMIYSPIPDTGTVSVVNGTTNKLTAGITYNVKPLNSGFIECNKKTISNIAYIRYEMGSDVTCQSKANTGFTFGYWSGDLSSDSPGTNFVVSKYGNVTANFIASPPSFNFSIPPSTLFQIFIIVITAIVGTLIPRIIDWINNVRQKKILITYMTSINSAYNNMQRLEELKKDISKIYAEGKINSSNYGILNDRILEYIESYEKKKNEN
jgi:YVTN family beta-propeller protein